MAILQKLKNLHLELYGTPCNNDSMQMEEEKPLFAVSPDIQIQSVKLLIEIYNNINQMRMYMDYHQSSENVYGSSSNK